MVHPLAEIDEAKAYEIDRLVALTKKQLGDARQANEPNLSDYIELLEVAAQQYAGVALAFGRRNVAHGARLLEEALDRFERIAKKQGDDATNPQTLFLLCVLNFEMGKKGAALSFVRRAVAAAPDNIDYRRLQDELESEPASGAPGRSGARSVGLVLVGALAAVAVVGGVGYLVLISSSSSSISASDSPDPAQFAVEPYTAAETMVARDTGSNLRTLPFARDDIPILRETAAGEMLHITGRVNRADGDWYRLQLADGQTAYLKATLVVAQSPPIEAAPETPAPLPSTSTPGWLGVAVGSVNEQAARVAGAPRVTGARIAAVVRGGPADMAGLRTGDVVERMNTIPIADARDLTQRFGSLRAGEHVVFGVWRDGQYLSIDVLPGDRPTQVAVAERRRTLEGQWRGIARQGSRQYRVVVEFSPEADERLSASIRYLDLGCSGTWREESGAASSPGRWRVRETITQGRSRCANSITDLTLLPDGTLSLEWRLSPGERAVVSGVLSRVS